MQFKSQVATCLVIIAALGLISVTVAQKNTPAKKPQFRGNTNYQHFLELEQKRRMKGGELEQRGQRKWTSSYSATTTTPAPTTTTTFRTTTTKTTTSAPVLSRRSMSRMAVLANDTMEMAASTNSGGRGSRSREVIRRKKKANIQLDSDNEIKPVRDEVDEEQPMGNGNNGRFLSPSVRRYLALGRAIPGRPGTDYPILSQVPYTNFYCDEQEYPGFFADMETRCQGWHYCDIDGRQATFLCPNGTQFSQAFFVCDWWFNVSCDLSPKLYSLNARLYQRPKTNTPPAPHRVITKVLIDEMFN